MGTTHVLVDKNRTYIPISATIVRKDSLASAAFLEPCVRAYFARRICIVGAESTGTTTLAKALAEHYATVWVPEYGRMYSEGKLKAGEGANWNSDEFMFIARQQVELEDKLAESSNGLVICDTDPFATSIWHERYMGAQLSELDTFAVERNYDLYIVTGDEIPFEQDGTRDGEHIRYDMHKRFIEKLKFYNKSFVAVSGNQEERLQLAAKEINKILVQ
jgi:HTH-type transcriptional repressor of NAD biosynthesis genes